MRGRSFVFVLLALYSLALILIELRTSQAFVRHFFTDIEGPVHFYAVNTTVSTFLLWATALLFAVCLASLDERRDDRLFHWFLITQIAVFAFLGFDDRFKFHETLAEIVHIGDHFVLLAVGAVEAGCLSWLMRRSWVSRRIKMEFVVASLLFCLMLTFDAAVPHDMTLRLSVEDLAKTWATLFFFFAAWDMCITSIRRQWLDPGAVCHVGR